MSTRVVAVAGACSVLVRPINNTFKVTEMAAIPIGKYTDVEIKDWASCPSLVIAARLPTRMPNEWPPRVWRASALGLLGVINKMKEVGPNAATIMASLEAILPAMKAMERARKRAVD